MKYYEVNFPNLLTLVMKVNYTPADFLELLESKRAIIHHSGTTHNLKVYQSFRELNNPDERQKRCALGIESVV